MNSTEHIRKKLYRVSTASFRGSKQSECFLFSSHRLPLCQTRRRCYKKTTDNLPHEHRCKNSQQIPANPTHRCTERTIHLSQMWFATGMQCGFNIQKVTHVIYHMVGRKEREHMILSIDAVSTCQNPAPLHDKASQWTSWPTSTKTTANITLNREELRAPPFRSGTR